jgi:DNA-binding NtrC family response regulator
MKTIDELAVQLLDGGFFMEEAVELLEKNMIAEALLRTHGNQCEASKMIGIHRNTLQRKMDAYKIDGRRRKPVGKPMASAGPAKTKRLKHGA